MECGVVRFSRHKREMGSRWADNEANFQYWDMVTAKNQSCSSINKCVVLGRKEPGSCASLGQPGALPGQEGAVFFKRGADDRFTGRKQQGSKTSHLWLYTHLSSGCREQLKLKIDHIL